jgi:hypothetical protein
MAALAPDGFVFNDNKIYRSICTALDRLPKGTRSDNPFTTMYPKTCADTESELAAHVGTTRRCAKC